MTTAPLTITIAGVTVPAAAGAAWSPDRGWHDYTPPTTNDDTNDEDDDR